MLQQVLEMNPEQLRDPMTEFKARQRETWALGNFGEIAIFTTQPAAHLVRFAGVKRDQTVLDVGTGTGVVAITAARFGAKVTGIDLTPELIAQARRNSAALGFDRVVWKEGDVEDLAFPASSFDVVLSQFGHMFAPRPDVATKEMLRVLKPGGTIAFATWPPDEMVGRFFALGSKYVPPPPDILPVSLWGDSDVVRKRLGDAVHDHLFERGTMRWYTLSPRHYRLVQEAYVGPTIRVVQNLSKDTAKLETWRKEYEAIVADYFEDNVVSMPYLLSRATKT